MSSLLGLLNMGNWIDLALAVLALAGGGSTLWFRRKAKNREKEAIMYKTRLVLERHSAAIQRRAMANITRAEQKNRKEMINAENEAANGRRDHFNTDW